MVTKMERDQSHKTPVTSTWTPDFLSREGEGRKAMGDWLRDKTIPWKTWRRLLQTNADVFPCEARLQKWGKHPDGICELCKRCREMGLDLLVGKSARGTVGHLQSSVCRLQAPAATGAHNAGFQQVQDDMSRSRSVNRDWEFVSKGTEISLGRFVSEFFTQLTLDIRINTPDSDKHSRQPCPHSLLLRRSLSLSLSLPPPLSLSLSLSLVSLSLLCLCLTRSLTLLHAHSRILTYDVRQENESKHVSIRQHTSAHESGTRKRGNTDVCRRMLTYADVS